MEYKTPFSFVLLTLLGVLVSACESDKPIVIGVLGTFSGKSSSFGLGNRNGVMLAVEEQNRRGGIRGRRIRLVVEDDGGRVDIAKKAFVEVLAEKPVAIIGPISSTMTLFLKPYADNSKLVMISPTATSTLLSDTDDYLFRVCSDSSAMAAKMAEYLRQRVTRVAVIYNLDNRAFSEDWFLHFSNKFTELGGELVTASTFNADEQSQYFQYTGELMKANPEAVLIIGPAPDTAMFAQQIRKFDKDIIIAGADGAASRHLIELGNNAVERLLVAQPINHNDTSESFVKFRQAYLERYSEIPGFPAVRGYEAAQVLIRALKTGNTDVKNALLGLGEVPAVQGTIKFTATGDVFREPIITWVKAKRFVPAPR